jgi:putative endonuclease
MEYIVYILFSEKHNKTYVGFTSSLIERFKSHNELATKGYTIKYRPWMVIHIEVYQSKNEAINREQWFKSGVGRDFISKLKNKF